MSDNENNYENLPSKSFSSICRTCLIMHSEMFLIKRVRCEDIPLTEIIQNWTSMQIGEDDQLPKNMCKPCIKNMYQTYNFLRKCKNSEIVLKRILHKEAVLENVVLENYAYEVESIEVESAKNNNYNIIPDDFLLDNSSELGMGGERKVDIPYIEEKNDDKSPNNILQTIQVIKKEIREIQLQNKDKLRRMQKAQLMSFHDIPKPARLSYRFQKGPPYTCITCNAEYQSCDELKAHKIETKHKRYLRYSCPFCHRKDKDYSTFIEHYRTHTGEKPNKCPTCGKGFNTKSDLKRHMLLHTEVKPHSCRFCSKAFRRKFDLTDHERKHTGERLICVSCGKGFTSYSNLLNHERAHKRRDSGVKSKSFQCHLCGKLLNEYSLKSHILLHGPKNIGNALNSFSPISVSEAPKNFTCEICGKTYVGKNGLDQHIYVTHQGNRFPCNLCDKKFRQKDGLQKHIESHSGQNNYPCDFCDKRFAWKCSLRQHKRIHTGDTKYQCKECKHISINRRNLEHHMRTHTGEKPFVCTFCGKAFAGKTNRTAHMKIHTDVKEHICKICDKAFHYGRGLRKHMATHEKNARRSSLLTAKSREHEKISE